MKNLSDDPRLTTFALGETEVLDAEERAAIQDALVLSQALREQVDATWNTARLVSAALRADRTPRPSPGFGQVITLHDETLPRPRAGIRGLHVRAAMVVMVVMAVGLALLSTQFLLRARIAPHEVPRYALPAPVSGNERGAQPRATAPSEEDRFQRLHSVESPGPPPATGLFAQYRVTARSEALRSLGYLADGRFDVGADRGLPRSDFNTEAYDRIEDNPFLRVSQNPLSTFSIDVDTASYSNVRRLLTQGMLPPRDAARIEEMINYFPYDYAPPEGDAPFSVNVEIAQAPWKPEHRLARIGLKGKAPEARSVDAGHNLVFLIDVSGSMQDLPKLPLVKRALGLLVEELDEADRVAMVVYAGASGLVLPSTPGAHRAAIRSAIERLEAGGSTNGGAGIELAYRVAQEHFVPGGVNRVILATDGDFNVGVTDHGSLTRLIEEKAKGGVFLTVLGFGMGNYKDATLEKLADRGNGNYAYIDTFNEARKVLVEELRGTLETIAKDVKIQIEFNPAVVGAYRLIGYENRLLRTEDFNDDTKDAGEIGAGHTVTALYELVPPGLESGLPGVDPLKYQTPAQTTPAASAGETLTLKLRYKEPEGDTSRLLSYPVTDEGGAWEEATTDFRFASAVAAFGMILRQSPHKGSATLEWVASTAHDACGDDRSGYRAEFQELVQHARALGAR